MSDHPLVRAETVALVAVGGFVGANTRWVLAGAAPGLLGTLLANVTGAFALGFVLYEAIGTGILSPAARTALATGFLSSYTTYSTFAVESALAGSPVLLASNVAANYGLGILGVVLGRAVANRVDDGGMPSL
jgi:CrcB protein